MTRLTRPSRLKIKADHGDQTNQILQADQALQDDQGDQTHQTDQTHQGDQTNIPTR